MWCYVFPSQTNRPVSYIYLHLKWTSLSHAFIGLNTGAGKPAVLPKQVTRVRVRFSFLAHRGTPLPVLRYCGYVRVNPNKVILIFTLFFLFFSVFFFSKFIMSHCDKTKYGTVSRVCFFASYYNLLSPSLPLPFNFKNNVSDSSMYQN